VRRHSSQSDDTTSRLSTATPLVPLWPIGPISVLTCLSGAKHSHTVFTAPLTLLSPSTL
jgi:hypothetical protein